MAYKISNGFLTSSNEKEIRGSMFTIVSCVMDAFERGPGSNGLNTTLSKEMISELEAIFGNTFYTASKLLETEDSVNIFLYFSQGARHLITVKEESKTYYILRNINLCQCVIYRSINKRPVMCAHVLAARIAFLTNRTKVEASKEQFTELLDKYLRLTK